MIKIQTIITNEMGERLIFDKIIKKDKCYLTILDDKVGVLNSYGIEIIKPIYDEITTTEYDFFIVREKNNVGLIDPNGKIVIPVSYTTISTFSSDGMVVICLDKKIGRFDIYTNIMVEPMYDYIQDFCKDMYKVQLENKFGVIDRNGNVIIAIKYDWISRGYGSLTKVCIDNKYGCVNEDGEEILKPEYDDVCRCISKHKFVFGRKGKEFICVTSTGKMIFRFNFSEGITEVREAFKRECYAGGKEYIYFECGLCIENHDGRYICVDENRIPMLEFIND